MTTQNRKVIFSLPGKRRDTSDVFLQSENRKYSTSYTLFHKNDFTTELIIPYDVFKKHFKFDRLSGIYRTQLTYGELKQIKSVRITVTESTWPPSRKVVESY